jgi:hypothetical protein
MLRHWRFLLVWIAFFFISVSGCSKTSSSSSGSNVSGKISFKGAPVTGGTISLHPKKGGGVAYPGTIKGDGSFSINGVPLSGEVVVTVETESIKESGVGKLAAEMKERGVDKATMEQMLAASKKGGASIYVEIPAKYSDPQTSPLTVTLNEGSENKFDLVLRD